MLTSRQLFGGRYLEIVGLSNARIIIWFYYISFKKEILKCKGDRKGLSKIYLFTAVRSALHFKISLSKSTRSADPDLHTDPATFGSCLWKWSLHSYKVIYISLPY